MTSVGASLAALPTDVLRHEIVRRLPYRSAAAFARASRDTRAVAAGHLEDCRATHHPRSILRSIVKHSDRISEDVWYNDVLREEVEDAGYDVSHLVDLTTARVTKRGRGVAWSLARTCTWRDWVHGAMVVAAGAIHDMLSRVDDDAPVTHKMFWDIIERAKADAARLDPFRTFLAFANFYHDRFPWGALQRVLANVQKPAASTLPNAKALVDEVMGTALAVAVVKEFGDRARAPEEWRRLLDDAEWRKTQADMRHRCILGYPRF